MNSPENETMQKSILSVVIPVGKMKGKLQNFFMTIESDFEKEVQFIVVIDDKRDGTAEEIRDFLAKNHSAERFKIIQNCFNGPGPARNAGLLAVTSPWVMFCDSDDILRTDLVCDVLKNVHNTSQFVVGAYFKKSKTSQNLYTSNTLTDVALDPGIWRIAFRREIAQRGVFPNLKLGEDQVFLVQTQLFQSKPVFSKFEFYSYFLGDPSQLSSRTENRNHILESIRRILVYGNLISRFSRENYYLGIIIIRLIITYLKMDFRGVRNLLIPNRIPNPIMTVGVIVGSFLIIRSKIRYRGVK